MEGKRPQEDCSVAWFALSDFMVTGLPYPGCLWPIILTQDPSWWRSAKMDFSEEDSGRLVGHMDWHLLLTFPEFFQLGLLVLCSSLGSSVIKLLMQMVTMGPGQGGRF